MLRTNNNTDLLFDDLAIMRSLHLSVASADSAIQYGDCGNRFETDTPNGKNHHDKSASNSNCVIAYGDCGN